jgi:hypothetical protein
MKSLPQSQSFRLAPAVQELFGVVTPNGAVFQIGTREQVETVARLHRFGVVAITAQVGEYLGVPTPLNDVFSIQARTKDGETTLVDTGLDRRRAEKQAEAFNRLVAGTGTKAYVVKVGAA